MYIVLTRQKGNLKKVFNNNVIMLKDIIKQTHV